MSNMGNTMLCIVYIVLRHTLCLWGKTVPVHVGQDGPGACGARRPIPHAYGHNVSNVLRMANYV